jgi:hypothetical protein
LTKLGNLTETLEAVKESRNALGVEDEDLSEKEAIVEVNEPDLYRKGGDHSFLADAYAARQGDYKAQERVNSNTKNMKLEMLELAHLLG